METPIEALLRLHAGNEVLRRLDEKGAAWKYVIQTCPPEREVKLHDEEYNVRLVQKARTAIGSRIPVATVPHAEMAPDGTSVEDFINHLASGGSPSLVDTVRILKAGILMLMRQPTLGCLEGNVIVVGDLHGQLGDLLHILQTYGMPSEKLKYCFNGDYVDRGNNGCEIFLLVLLLKMCYPPFVHINRGNHEDEALNLVYGFYDECTSKYGHYVYTLFRDAFSWLPLCCTINHRVFVVHGGLSGVRNLSLSEINLIRRGPHPKLSKRQIDVMTHFLWSDPNPADLGARPSPRGEGVLFGEDVTQSFLAKNSMSLVVRSHQYPGEKGYLEHHRGAVLTVFSASNYTLAGWKISAKSAVLTDGAATEKCNKGSVMLFDPNQKDKERVVETYDPPMWVGDDPRNSVRNPHTKRPFQYSVPYGTLSALYRGGVDPVERCVNHIRNSCVRHGTLLTFFWEAHQKGPGVITRETWLEGIASVTNVAQCTVIAPSLETALRNRGFVNADGTVRFNAFLQQASYLVNPRPLPEWHRQVMRLAVSKEGIRPAEPKPDANEDDGTGCPQGVNEGMMAMLMAKHVPELPKAVHSLVSSGIRGSAGFKVDEDDATESDRVVVEWRFAEDPTGTRLQEAEQRLRYLLRLLHTAGTGIDSAQYLRGCNYLLGAPLADAQLAALATDPEPARL
eukprot:TRINITY_DN44004_c0_g1_i1.p1 TRINITY_DN44004_c0_g1~~TRINITY_DN44004_c0_g1_i1.p1  ORF type:complete len:678 (+),score=198.69 TRINITY_DN44004_c0_g1_i1:132-2165(+)